MSVNAKGLARCFIAHGAGKTKTLKLLYFAQGLFLAMTGRPLFDDSMKRWPLGPVVYHVWSNWDWIKQKKVPTYDDHVSLFVSKVIRAFPQNATKLSKMTHTHPAWIDTAPDGIISPERAMQSIQQDPNVPQDFLNDYLRTLMNWSDDDLNEHRELWKDSKEHFAVHVFDVPFPLPLSKLLLIFSSIVHVSKQTKLE